MFNSLLGITASFLLKDNIVIACIIGALAIVTILMVERIWLNENIFRNKKKYAISAYSILLVLFLLGMFIVTEPMRKTSAIIASTTTFLTEIKSGDYKTAYSLLSEASKLSYPLENFTKDHSKNNVKIRDFTIEQVTFNKYDRKKAIAVVTSPFTLYGHETLNLELIKENKSWHIVFSRNNIVKASPPESAKTKRSGGAVSNFFNYLF
jgi:hypothetical protein